MIIRRTLIALALLFVPALASAQTHPCDVAPVLNPSLTSPVIIQWCWDGLDVNGGATAVAWTVTIDSTVVFTGSLTASGPASAVNGKSLYETAPIVPPSINPPVGNVGSHTVTVLGTNVAGQSALATIYPFTVVLPLPPPIPSRPILVGVRK
jgi:hypothetical protein